MSSENNQTEQVDVQLDTRGLSCPLPLLKLKQKLNQMERGQKVDVTTTDQGSVRDFSAFLEQVGHILHHQSQQGGEYRFIIEKTR